MRFTEMTIPEVVRIDLEKIEDDRGFFARLFCSEQIRQHGLVSDVVQINNTVTKTAGSIRGMHFQRDPMAETKIVRCLKGAIFDVAIDIRLNSATYGRWCAMELTEHNRAMAYIPKGFAHGFQTLAPDTELLYLHSTEYSPKHESGIHPLDDSVGIEWPKTVASMSKRDQELPAIADLEPAKIWPENAS